MQNIAGVLSTACILSTITYKQMQHFTYAQRNRHRQDISDLYRVTAMKYLQCSISQFKLGCFCL